MPIIIDEKELMNEIKELLKEIKDKIAVEKIISNTWSEGLRGIPRDVVGTPTYAQMMFGTIRPIEQQLEALKTVNDIEELIIIKKELKKVNKEIDVTGQKYNWGNARKYQTPNNPEFLKRIKEIKGQCLKRQSEYLSNASSSSSKNRSAVKGM